MNEDTRPFNTTVEWVPPPPCFTTGALAHTYLWQELRHINRNHGEAAQGLPGLAQALHSVNQAQRTIMHNLGQDDDFKPRFPINWRGGKIVVEPVFHGYVNLPGEQYSSLYIVLGDTNEAGKDDYEEVNLVFLRPGAADWQPFVVNEHGQMAVVVAHYRLPHIQTPLDVVKKPLWQLRGLPD